MFIFTFEQKHMYGSEGAVQAKRGDRNLQNKSTHRGASGQDNNARKLFLLEPKEWGGGGAVAWASFTVSIFSDMFVIVYV
jgi:hypothetical protein